MTIRNLVLIAQTVWLQALRRKDLYVIFVMAGFFGLWVAASRIIGIDSAGTASFLMSLGLSASFTLSAIVAAVFGSRQLPGEFEARTLYPLLARPVARGEVFLGKALGVATISIGTLIILALIAYVPTPKAEEQSFAMLVQALLLQSVALALLTVFSMALSLVTPAAVAMLISLTVYFMGAAILNYAASALGGAAAHALVFVPDFSIFNHAQRFVDGGAALSMVSFGGIALYGAGLAAALVAVAASIFNRKRI